jgi:hypothetical protein
MVGANDFRGLIQELHSELNQTPVAAVADRLADRWHIRAQEVVRRKVFSPSEFLEWAKRDRHWSFTLAEVMGKVCAKPSELAARLLVAILEELREEQQTAAPALE